MQRDAAVAQKPNDGPQSKYWIVTGTHLEGDINPAWPRGPNGKPQRPEAEKRVELYTIGQPGAWQVPARALAKMDACWVTGERGEGAEDPQDGLLHIHLAIKMRTKIRSQPLRLLLGLKPHQYHSEVMRNPSASFEYCAKEETRLPGVKLFQYGQKPTLKDRGMPEEEKDKLHLEGVMAMKRGAGEDWFEADPKRRRFFRGTGWQVKNDLLRRQQPSSAFTPIMLIILRGGTGLGKTAVTMEFLKDLDFWTPPCSNKPFGSYFDGYRGQGYMLIDDFEGFCNFRTMLKITGGYQQRGEVKCSGTVLRIHTVIITMDRDWREMRWGLEPEVEKRRFLSDNEKAQFERRITIEYEFEAGAINTPPLPPHPAGRCVGPIYLKNGLWVVPRHLPAPSPPQPWQGPLPPEVLALVQLPPAPFPQEFLGLVQPPPAPAAAVLPAPALQLPVPELPPIAAAGSDPSAESVHEECLQEGAVVPPSGVAELDQLLAEVARRPEALQVPLLAEPHFP